MNKEQYFEKIAEYKLLAKHEVGQNFLIDADAAERIVDLAAIDESDTVLEIGSGAGSLSFFIDQKASKADLIDIDEGLIQKLIEDYKDSKTVNPMVGNAMKWDYSKYTKIISNLPYYITSPVIMKLLSEDLPIENFTVMVQKEAADRLCADVGTRAAGAVTVAIQYYAEAEQLFFVSKGSFLPAPKVDSEVIRLTLRKPGTSDAATAASGTAAATSGTVTSTACDADSDRLSKEDAERFFKMVQAGFSQRRKTIMNSFSAALGMNKADLGALLDSVDVPRTARIEQLTMDQLLAVYKASR